MGKSHGVTMLHWNISSLSFPPTSFPTQWWGESEVCREWSYFALFCCLYFIYRKKYWINTILGLFLVDAFTAAEVVCGVWNLSRLNSCRNVLLALLVWQRSVWAFVTSVSDSLLFQGETLPELRSSPEPPSYTWSEFCGSLFLPRAPIHVLFHPGANSTP